MFGVADEGAGGLALVTFVLWDSFVKGGFRE